MLTVDIYKKNSNTGTRKSEHSRVTGETENSTRSPDETKDIHGFKCTGEVQVIGHEWEQSGTRETITKGRT